jgi:hypothetical protein
MLQARLSYLHCAVWAALFTFCSPPALAAEENEPAASRVDFAKDIYPILEARCNSCHGPDEQEGQLRLDAKAVVFSGGVSGKLLTIGKGKESLLYQRIAGIGDEDRMPLDDEPLPAEQTELLRRWIDEGAEWPDGIGANVKSLDKHWAYVKPVRAPLPAVAGSSWVRNPIDAFVLARLEKEGLAPSPPVDRARLIRRVYLDLIGLPPSVEQVDAFVSDPRPDAYERVVDELLASKHYGQRWARQWLDLARYADTNGYQADQYRDVWPYRDWVIRAMNDGMPFDQFTIEQIAGDLLPGATVDQKVATGFHRLTTCNVEAGVDPEENRVNQLIDRVNTTGTVWLGSTIECAQCHNHKYDPFTQQDYYRLFAYFNNTPLEVEGNGIQFEFVGPKMPLPLAADKEVRLEQLQSQLDELRQQLDAATAAAKTNQAEWEQTAGTTTLPDAIAKILAVPADKRNDKQQKQLSDYYLDSQPSVKKLRDEIAAAQKQIDAIQPLTTLVMVEMNEPRMNNIFKRGNFLDKGQPVQPGTPKVLHRLPADAPTNRLTLAQWLVSPDNPLTARVAVNRWWAEIFGQGIVATIEDFGTQGEPPTHRELLDWLAVEFMEGSSLVGSSVAESPSRSDGQQWSMKHVHKLMVMSSTYQQSSRVTPQLHRRDPYNKLYARGPRFRLPAETVRDNALAISGLLSDKMDGPPVFPPQPDGIWRHVGRNEPKYATSQGPDRFRRGIYVFWRRSAPYASFVNFDAPDRASCVAARSRTNTPLQALTLLNDPAYIEMAVALATRIAADHKQMTDEEKVAYGFRLCVAREPNEAELNHLMEVYRRELARFESNASAAEAIVGKQSKAPDDSPGELAAWFYVANILLNLDETITKG